MSNFSFTKIDVPAAAGTYVYISADGVDAAGVAVGNYGNVDGLGDGTFDGLVTVGNIGTTYDPPGSTNTDVVGVTSAGEIFGNYVDNVNRQHGFVDNGGVVTQINVSLANSTTVSGVNDQGVIYGSFADASNKVHGFLDNGGSYAQVDVPGSNSTSVVGINASGAIVGTYTDAQFFVHGFVESGGSFKTIDPAGSIFTSVVGVSDAGVIVGNYDDSANNQHSFIDNNGVITTINIPGASSTGISAVNAAGEIVGYYSDSVGNIHGFIDNNGSVVTVDVPGATQTDIFGVSDSGEITGYYNDSTNHQHGFVGLSAPVTIESSGSTELVESNGYFYLDSISSGAGPELQHGGAPISASALSTWTPIGAEQTSSGYEIAFKVPGSDQYTVWNTDSNGNFISGATGGTVTGESTTLESLETTFHQDLNGDGVIGIPMTVIESSGSTKLVESNGDFYLDSISSGTGPELLKGGAPVSAGSLGTWTPIGAEQTGFGYEVAFKVAGTDQYTVWNTDSNGIFISAATPGSAAGESVALESLETSFHQDLNGDGTIGVVTTVIEAAGSTTLEEVGDNFYFLSGGSIPVLKVNGEPFVVDGRDGLTPIGAEEVTTVVNDTYDVALKVAGADQYVVWSVDADGNYISALTDVVPGHSATLESYEPIFHQDLNGDGNIGIVTTVIEADGSTALTEVANDFYFYSGGVGPEFQLNGTPYVVGTSGVWTPIGAEHVSGGGYEVALKVAGADQYTVWNTDSNGNFVSAVIGTVAGNSAALESLETIFHQDLNGDGVIGSPITVIESSGSTKLVESNSNFYLDSISSGTGPELLKGGAPVSESSLGTWTPIGAEQTSGGYEVAFKVAGVDQYTVWNVDGNGNFLSAATPGGVTGENVALESLETSFHQDLNGDGVIGAAPTTVIESFGSTKLVTSDGYFFLDGVSSGTGPELFKSGAPVTASSLSNWTPIGAEPTSGGYEVAFKASGVDQYTVWNVDGNGNFLSAATPGGVTGESNALESLETSFHQDLNGDGVIGLAVAPHTTMELSGAHSDNVTFEGSTGLLKLDSPSTFSGQIAGFTGDGTLSGSDQVDLPNLTFSSAVQADSSYDSSTDTLTISDGAHVDVLKFIGSYSQANFKFTNDSSGGTIVFDPPAGIQPTSAHAGAPANAEFGHDNFVFAPNPGQASFNGGPDPLHIDHATFAELQALVGSAHDDPHANAFVTGGTHVSFENAPMTQLFAHHGEFHLV